MPYTDNNGIKIYYAIEGNGIPIVMMPGFLGTIKSWDENNYVDSLKKDYPLL